MRRIEKVYIPAYSVNDLIKQGVDVYAFINHKTEFLKAGTYHLNSIPWIYCHYIVNFLKPEDRSLYVEKYVK